MPGPSRHHAGNLAEPFGTAVMAAFVKGFGCRPLQNLVAAPTGRRPKAAGEGRRGEWGTRLSGLYGDLVGADGAV